MSQLFFDGALIAFAVTVINEIFVNTRRLAIQKIFYSYIQEIFLMGVFLGALVLATLLPSQSASLLLAGYGTFRFIRLALLAAKAR